LSKLPAVDLYVAGPPCQSFSAAGLKLGLADPRGQLLNVSVKYIEDKKPAAFVLENVANLARTFADVLGDLLETLLGVFDGSEARRREADLIKASLREWPDMCKNKAADSRGLSPYQPAYVYVVSHGVCKTITRSRGATGYYCTSLGRRLCVSEMLRLQGLRPGDVSWEAAGVARTNIGKAIGHTILHYTMPLYYMMLCRTML
jgi:site-specific DNA-cytosine methylase